MDALHASAAVLTDWLIETSIHVAILFVLVLAISSLLGRRLPTRWRHALWALVLVRLLLPAIPATPVSVHNVAQLVPRSADVISADPADRSHTATGATTTGATTTTTSSTDSVVVGVEGVVVAASKVGAHILLIFQDWAPTKIVPAGGGSRTVVQGTLEVIKEGRHKLI